jgi:hypothetical protein
MRALDPGVLRTAGVLIIACVFMAAGPEARAQEELKEPRTIASGGEVVGLAASPKGDVLAGCGGRSIRIWDARTWTERGKIDAPTEGTFTCVAFRSDGVLASGSSDGAIRMWDAGALKERGTLKGHAGAVRCLAWTPDGKMLISGGDDKTIRLWTVEALQERAAVAAQDVVTCLAVDAAGKTLASGTRASAKLWSLPDGKELLELKEAELIGLAFTHEGLLVTAAPFAVKVWNAKTGTEENPMPDGARLRGEPRDEEKARSFVLSPAGTRAATGAAGSVSLWELRFPHPDLLPWSTDPFAKGSGAVVSLTVDPEGRWLAAATSKGEVRLWPLPEWRLHFLYKRAQQELDRDKRYADAIVTINEILRVLDVLGGGNVQAWGDSLEEPGNVVIDVRRTAHYNLACAYSLKGEKQNALDELAKAVKSGYASWEHIVEDHDLDAIRDEARFKTICTAGRTVADHLSKGDEAANEKRWDDAIVALKQAVAILDKEKDSDPKDRRCELVFYFLAKAHAQKKETAAALDALDRAVKAGLPLFVLEDVKELAPIRGEARYKEIVAAVKKREGSK